MGSEIDFLLDKKRSEIWLMIFNLLNKHELNLELFRKIFFNLRTVKASDNLTWKKKGKTHIDTRVLLREIANV